MPCQLYPVVIDSFEEYRLFQPDYGLVCLLLLLNLMLIRHVKYRLRSLESIVPTLNSTSCPKVCLHFDYVIIEDVKIHVQFSLGY